MEEMEETEPVEPTGRPEGADEPVEPREPAEPTEPLGPTESSEPQSEPHGLRARERAVLAMERRGFAGPGAKEREIRERLGLAPVRYYQLLNALLDDPRALAHDPVTVNRLRRVREARRAER